MFLHALLFFLLVTSVFAAPAGSKTKSRPEGYGSNHKVQEVETTPESHLGFWYPADISNPSLVIEILRDKIRVRQLNQDGEVLPDPNPPVVSKDNDYLMADRGWRRLPQAYQLTPFYRLSDCLSTAVGPGGHIFYDFFFLKTVKATVKTTQWGGTYWYQVPSSGSSNVDAVSAPVVQFNNDGTIAGIYNLGANGGVATAEFDANPDPKAMVGTYLLLPTVSGLLQHYNIGVQVVSLPNFTVVIGRLTP